MKRDILTFQIEWSTRQKAKLHFLIDNGLPVASDADDLQGRGSLCFEYSAPSANVHRLEWSLWFPSKTLESLQALAALPGGPLQTLQKAEKKTNRWADEGILR